jgi:hypothetical protein
MHAATPPTPTRHSPNAQPVRLCSGLGAYGTTAHQRIATERAERPTANAATL